MSIQLAAATSFVETPSVTFTWRLTGIKALFFTGAPNGAAGQICSPSFSAFGKQWRLVLYPNGDNAKGKGNVTLCLQLTTLQTSVTLENVTATFGPSTYAFGKTTLFSTMYPRPADCGEAWGKDVEDHAVISAAPQTFFPGGVATFTVNLRKCEFKAKKTTEVSELTMGVDIPSSRIASDLSRLLESGDDANVTLLCLKERIMAHSAILCARSPVFKAQLKGELACRFDAVPVPDEIDAPTMKLTLEFIYTDECEPASAEEAQHLLNAADHYGLERLRAICERKLVDYLSITNAAYSLTLAEQHSTPALKNAAIRYVAANAVAVVATDGWKHLLASTPVVAGQALVTLATGDSLHAASPVIAAPQHHTHPTYPLPWWVRWMRFVGA